MAAAIASASDKISATPYQSSSPHPAASRECTYRNDIDRPLSEQLCVLRSILQHFGGDSERPVRGRDARVDGDLQQYLLDLAGRQVVGQRGPDVHGELLLLAENGERGQGDHAALGTGEARPGPDVTPGVAREELLERGGEVGRLSECAVDVIVAQDLAADCHALLGSCFVVHRGFCLQNQSAGGSDDVPAGAGWLRNAWHREHVVRPIAV